LQHKQTAAHDVQLVSGRRCVTGKISRTGEKGFWNRVNFSQGNLPREC